MPDLARAIHQALKQASGRRRPTPDRRFNQDDAYITYGLRTDELRRILRRFRADIRDLPLSDRLALAERLIATRIAEPGHAGIYVLGECVNELKPSHLRRFSKVADNFTGWAHVDDFCGSVMQPLLERMPEEVCALCEQWNRSHNRWKRRASVVTFTRKVGESGRYTEIVLRLCDNLIWDEDDLVQKGVGWALKDNLRAAPGQLIAYVIGLRRMGVPSTITLYAIRDLEGVDRDRVLSVRKES